MKKLVLFAALMVLCFGLFAADPNGAKDIVPPPTNDNPAPYNLEGAVININDVQLCWTNPAFTDVPMGFRVYCNNTMVMYIPGENIADCVVMNVCDGCHDFYVTAYFDSGSETPPSNTIQLVLTPNSDNTINPTPLTLKAYPNPFRSGVSLSMANAKANEEIRLTIFNAKGQSVKTALVRGGNGWNWDTRDNSGNRVPAGIYFAKAVSGSKSTLVKLMLTQ